MPRPLCLPNHGAAQTKPFSLVSFLFLFLVFLFRYYFLIQSFLPSKLASKVTSPFPRTGRSSLNVTRPPSLPILLCFMFDFQPVIPLKAVQLAKQSS